MAYKRKRKKKKDKPVVAEKVILSKEEEIIFKDHIESLSLKEKKEKKRTY